MEKKYSWYNISADGGKSWTAQYMTEEDVKDEIAKGYIVNIREGVMNCKSPYFTYAV